jgi:hypothetical protein
MARDYIPGPDAAFDTFFKNLVQYVVQKTQGSPPAWTHIPQTAVTALSDSYNAWRAAYEVTLKPCTKPERDEKNRVRGVSEKDIRGFVNIYLRFHPDVTDNDRENMGLHIPDAVRTPVTPPETGPRFHIAQLGPGALGVIYQDGEGRKGSKPRGVSGARIYYGVFDEPPADQNLLPASTWATRCPHRVTFREGDRGKKAFFALKWEIGKGGESPWSEIQGEIVP